MYIWPVLDNRIWPNHLYRQQVPFVVHPSICKIQDLIPVMLPSNFGIIYPPWAEPCSPPEQFPMLQLIPGRMLPGHQYLLLPATPIILYLPEPIQAWEFPVTSTMDILVE